MRDCETGGDLARRMLGNTLSNEAFRHRQHLELAYYYLTRHEYDVALSLLARSIRDFAALHGGAGKFHLTLTACWARIVAAALHAESPRPSFDRLLESRPDLLNKALPARYYSDAVLHAPAARESVLQPDLHPLPEIREVAG